MFKVTNGEVEVLESPFGKSFTDNFGRTIQVSDKALKMPQEEEENEEVPTSRASFPARGFRFVSKTIRSHEIVIIMYLT